MALIYIYVALAFLVALIAQIRGRAGWRWFSIAVFATPLIAGLVVMALPRQRPPPVSFESPGPTPTSEGELAPADSTVRIIRLAAHSDRFKPYDILVNGKLVGAVVPNNVVDFHVPSGALVIEARSYWGESPPLLAEAAAGHQVNIEVSKQPGPLGLWAAVFRPDRYLTLTRLSMVEAADKLRNKEHAPSA